MYVAWHNTPDINLHALLKLSQSDLALKAGLHPNVLGRYESDIAVPSVEVAARIAKALDISLDYLSELSDVELDKIVLTRIQDITSLPDDDRTQVFKVIDALIRDYKAGSK